MRCAMAIILAAALSACESPARRVPPPVIPFEWLDACWHETNVLEHDPTVEIYVESHGIKWRIDKRHKAKVPALRPSVILTTPEGAYLLDLLGLTDDGRPAPTTLPVK